MSENNFGEKHILVVDDDPVQLRLIKGYLQDEYKVTLIHSGKMAIEYLIDNHPDLILLDYVMPLYNGPTVYKIIRSKEKSQDIPIFFLTGATDKEIVLECLSYNPAGYIVKPVTKRGLLNKIDDFFGVPVKPEDESERDKMRQRILDNVENKKRKKEKTRKEQTI